MEHLSGHRMTGQSSLLPLPPIHTSFKLQTLSASGITIYSLILIE